MPKTGKQVLDGLTKQVETELDSLSKRLETGGKTIDAELSESRKEGLLRRWTELDKVYKRLQLLHSILVSSDEAPCRGVYCAVCLGLVEPKQLLEAGWEMPEEEKT